MSSNNMYNILNTLKSLEPTPEQTVKETARRIYESVEAQGSITEGVNRVEQTLNEKYMGFKAVEKAAKKGGAENPAAVAASVGRKKYGKKAFQKAAASGKKMHESQGMAESTNTQHVPIGQQMANDGITYSREKEGEIIDLMVQYMKKDGMSPKSIRYCLNYDKDYIPDQLSYLPRAQGMAEMDGDGAGRDGSNRKRIGSYGTRDRDIPGPDVHLGAKNVMNRKDLAKRTGDVLDKEFEKSHKKGMGEGTVHKGTYGTSYDPSDEEKKDKPKREIKHGQKGRPKAEKPLDTKAAPKGDIFGRTTGDVPKGKKGTRVKGKDMVDEVITKKTSAGEIIHDFQKSKNPKFAGKSKEQRKNQALGAYYGMHPEKSKKESMAESTDYKKQNFLFESFNFANMMKETDQTVQEMLTELQNDIANFKLTGECSPKLDAFLRVHGHSKKQLADEAKMPKVLDKIGSAVKTGWEKLSHPDDNAMLDKLYKDTLPPGTSSAPDNAHDELDELAQLAGITDEGNAFTGKLAKTAHGDSFDLDGKTYKDTSHLDEATCNECGMYESQCSCTEGNLFTKKLAQTPKGGEFELDGKQYKDTSNLDETSMKLEDIARLAGIAVEGKDYGDTSFNEAPTYDNTPDEQVQGEDVLLKGGDGEVAGQEKKMAKHGAARFSDNPLAMKEAATFDPIEAMGRKLMTQYESIKLQK